VTTVSLALGFPFFFLFLFIPVIPLLGRRRQVRRCPACGWETEGEERFCPWDGSPLPPEP
jgi:hypothetical protein